MFFDQKMFHNLVEATEQVYHMKPLICRGLISSIRFCNTGSELLRMKFQHCCAPPPFPKPVQNSSRLLISLGTGSLKGPIPELIRGVFV